MDQRADPAEIHRQGLEIGPQMIGVDRRRIAGDGPSGLLQRLKTLEDLLSGGNTLWYGRLSRVCHVP